MINLSVILLMAVLTTHCCELPVSPSNYCSNGSYGIEQFSIPDFPPGTFDTRALMNWLSSTSGPLERTAQGVTYIFPTGLKDCEADLAKLEYCYSYKRGSAAPKIFEIRSLHPARRNDKYIFESESLLSVTRNRTSSSCTNLTNDNILCCDALSVEDFVLTSFAGIFVESNYHLLRYRSVSPSNFSVQQYIVSASISFVVSMTSEFCTTYHEGLPLLKFHLGKDGSTVGSSVPTTEYMYIGSTSSVTESANTDNSTVVNELTVSPPSSGLSMGTLVGLVTGFASVLLIMAVIIALLLLCFVQKKQRKSSFAMESQTFKQGLPEQVKCPVPDDRDIGYYEVGPTVDGKHQEYFILEPPMDYEQPFEFPAEDEESLYAQILDKTLAPTLFSLKLGAFLGSGQFGAVFKGTWLNRGKESEVAVKTLKEGANKEDRVKFLQEAAIMGQFKHPNIVTMHGLVSDKEQILIILELLGKGDLRQHLLASRPGGSAAVNGHSLLSYCRQVAAGMVYLSNKGFVHRDLAARNILVSEDDICKISDFGMSRDLADESYYKSHGGLIPVKWTAPEALYYKKYSTSSDVWSYGVVMYEIWSLGLKPFEENNNSEVLKMLDSGYRLPPPPGCPRSVYKIMMSCWNPQPNQRPSFESINQQICISDSKLLQWTEEDSSARYGGKLGEELSSSRHMYKDLQDTYT